MVREDLEDPVVRAAQEVPGDQEDREVTIRTLCISIITCISLPMFYIFFSFPFSEFC